MVGGKTGGEVRGEVKKGVGEMRAVGWEWREEADGGLAAAEGGDEKKVSGVGQYLRG